MYPNTADGFINDLHEYIKPINFEGITVPTLLVHGNMDGDIPFSQAEEASSKIPGAELYRVENGWHILAFHKDWKQIYDYEIAFVKKNMNI